MSALFSLFAVFLSAGYHAQNVLAAYSENKDALSIKLYFVFLAVIFAGMGVLYFLYGRKKRISLHRLFFFASMFFGILYMCVMPGLSAPDEVSHYSTAYRLSSKLMGKPDLTLSGLVSVRKRDYPLEDMEGVKTPEIPDDIEKEPKVMGRPVENQSYRDALMWSSRYTDSDEMTSSALPDIRTTRLMYIPQAIGFAAVRMMGGSTMLLLFAGKILNLLLFSFLISRAIAVSPVGKELFFAAGMLPMSLHLGASLSYDAGIIGTVFLFAATVFSVAFRRDGIRTRELLILCGLAAIFAPCKMVYFPLVFLSVLIPSDAFGGKKKKAMQLSLIFFSACLSMWIVNGGILSAYANPANGAVSEAVCAGRGQYTAGELMRRPHFIVRMVFDTFSLKSGELLGGVVGSKLGNLDPLLGAPVFVVCLYWAGMFLLSLSSAEKKLCLRGREKRLVAVFVSAVVLLTAGAMLLSWTTREASVIEGIQGRYFLPILPLSLLLFRDENTIWKGISEQTILFSFMAMNAYVIIRVFALACLRI